MTGWQVVQQDATTDAEMNELLEGEDFQFPLVYNNQSSAWYWANVINDILAQDERYPSVRVTVRRQPEQTYPPITKEALDRKARSLFP